MRGDRGAEQRADDPEQQDHRADQERRPAQQQPPCRGLGPPGRVRDGHRGERRPRRAGADHSAAPEPQPRIEQRVEHVRDQRGHHVHHADGQHAGLEHGEVLVLGRREDQLPDALVVEQRLHDDQAADQVSGLGGDDGDRRQQRVAQYVPPDHHRALAGPSGSRCGRSRIRAPRSCRPWPSGRCSRRARAPAGSRAGSGDRAGSAGDAPGPAEAETGNHFSSTPKMTMTHDAGYELGHGRGGQAGDRDDPVGDLARTLSAAMTPPMMPSGTTMMKASAAELERVDQRGADERPDRPSGTGRTCPGCRAAAR